MDAREPASPTSGLSPAETSSLTPCWNPPDLSQMRLGGVGRILAVSGGDRDVERGLLEMGFVEGACVEVLHHGFWGRDPLAVRINQTMTVALRRGEASAVRVGPLLGQEAGMTSPAKPEGNVP